VTGKSLAFHEKVKPQIVWVELLYCLANELLLR
jgi:hypothetical protein